MVRFSDPRAQPGVAGSDVANRSPDGKYIAIVTTRGLLSSDLIESRLSVFNTDRLKGFLDSPAGSPPLPRILATVVSYPHREQTMAYAAVIKDVRWSPDGAELFYKMENLQGGFQLCAAKLDGSGVITLSSVDEDVDQFDIAKNMIVYTVSHRGDDPSLELHAINADARVATGSLLYELLFPAERAQNAPQTWTLSVLRFANGSWTTRRVPLFSMRARSLLSDLNPFRISPDRQKLLTLTPAQSIPKSWERFEPISGFEHGRLRNGNASETDPTNPNAPRRYALIDLATGKETPLVDAPEARSLGYAQQRRIVPSSDGKRVLITNVFMPSDDSGRMDLRSTKPCAIVSVDLPSLASRCVLSDNPELPPNSLQEISFGKNDNQVVVLLRQGSEKQYEFRDSRWTLVAPLPVDHTKLSEVPMEDIQSRATDIIAAVRESLNEPPTLWAEDRGSGRRRLLWDPNPQFSQVRFAPASLFQWVDRTGYEWKAELVRPIDYVPGVKYPLVLQMYAFDEGQFLTDGLDPTAFAARHLAGAGFFVLQIRKRPSSLSEADSLAHLEGYRSAIEELSKQGLVDPRRVGVVGFSWTCWYAVDALVHAPGMFAAATVADGFDNSYMQYLLFAVDVPPIQRQMERIRGGSPFGDGLKRWVEESPGFHLDRVRTPVRIEAINPTSVLQEWELYGSLRLQQKPVDLIYFPNGTHIHQRPLERLESQQGNVDWFRFWLQDYEDPDPSKRSQYERWRELKRLNSDSASTSVVW
jgi:hypothetical protein